MILTFPFIIVVLHVLRAFASGDKRLTRSKAIQNFADPAVIFADQTWYAFATSDGVSNVPVAESPNFNQWTSLQQDALPTLPDWAQAPVWAPDVVALDDGSFVLYFAAGVKMYDGHHCIGAAISYNVSGPYSPQPKPLICPDPTGQGADVSPIISSSGKGGAIDPSGYKDVDGQRYIAYKVDGNSVGSGGICGNSNNGSVPTPLMLVAVASDGMTPTGDPPAQLLDRIEIDGPLIESPSIVRGNNSTYILLYSSNCFSSALYNIQWAYATSITGPYTRAINITGPSGINGILMASGVDGLTSPGGASIAADGTHMVFHADTEDNTRSMYTNLLHVAAGPNVWYNPVS